MALVRVIDNQTGEETTVDEAWLTRWPDDFTQLSDDHVPLVEQERRRAEHADSGGATASPVEPSNGTPEKKEK